MCYDTDKHMQSRLSQNSFYFTVLYSSIVLKALEFSSSVSLTLWYGGSLSLDFSVIPAQVWPRA